MASRVRLLRGLRHLRTPATQADKRMPAHKAYLRVSFLELERARLEQEMRAARQRLEAMAARCQEIGLEQAALLASPGQQTLPGMRSGHASAPPPPGSRVRQRFRLSY